METNNCKNCNESINGNYCSNCGQPTELKRIDRHYIVYEIKEVLFTNSGFLFTIKRLLTNPGESIREYITEDRSRYVKPITFLIITSLIFTFVNHFFHIGTMGISTQQSETEFPTVKLFLNWMVDYHGYSAMISGLFIAFWVKLFFRKSGYNFFEIFVLLCFVSGLTSFCFSFIQILQGLTHLRLIRMSLLVALIYHIWAIGQFFDKRKAESYIKAFFSFVLGIVSFSVLVASIGVFIDIIIK